MAPSTYKIMENTKNDFILLIRNQLKNENGVEFIQEIISLLFKGIKQTTNLEEADLIFNNLDNIQHVLAEAIFREHIIVSPFLRNFVYDFDRIDDAEYKERLYQKIKTNYL